MKYFSDLLDIIFPNVCVICGALLADGELSFCTKCNYSLPKARFKCLDDNPVARLFWGRSEIEYATSYLSFSKGSKSRKLIHNLKYKNKPDVGLDLGRMFGKELQSTAISEINMIIPVPLHLKKKRQRGYNQSEIIARGIGEGLCKPCCNNVLSKKKHTETQTRRSRYDRWLNVETIFEVNDPLPVWNSHVLLVDDVVTTGSTLEACCNILKHAAPVKISIASLAYAH